jgi:MFS family permease
MSTSAVSLRTGCFVGLSVLLNTLVGTFSNEKLSFLFKDVLDLDASGAASVAIITGIPGYLRVLMGAMSDFVPWFGYYRRSYYAASWILYAASMLLLAALPKYGYATVVVALISAGAGGNLLFVVMDAVMVHVGNLSGNIGRLQVVQQSVPLLMGLTFSGPLSGYVTQHWPYQTCFGAAAVCATLGIPLTLLIPEKRISKGDRLRHTGRMRFPLLRSGLSTPGFWVLFLFIFYLIITPGESTAKFYYSVDVLHLSKQTLGNLGIAGSAGAIVGMFGFSVVSRWLPILALVWGAFAMDAIAYVISFALRNEPTAYGVAFALSASSIVYTLCLLSLAARACPPSVEATVYGLLIGAINFAGSLGDKLGSTIYEWFGPASGNSIEHGWQALLVFGLVTTLLAPALIPFLPEWARSLEPLRPVTTFTAE